MYLKSTVSEKSQLAETKIRQVYDITLMLKFLDYMLYRGRFSIKLVLMK